MEVVAWWDARERLRLVPPPEMLGPLRSDYGKMREMFSEDPPAFEELISELRVLEAQINGCP